MKLLHKIISFYQYVYFRLFLFHKKQWEGNKGMGMLNSSFAIGASNMSLIAIIDILVSKAFSIPIIFDNIQSILLLAAIVLPFQYFVLKVDEDLISEKYSNKNENQFIWNLKGILSLLFVFGPIVLLIILI